jgi:hypothetical protein
MCMCSCCGTLVKPSKALVLCMAVQACVSGMCSCSSWHVCGADARKAGHCIGSIDVDYLLPVQLTMAQVTDE